MIARKIKYFTEKLLFLDGEQTTIRTLLELLVFLCETILSIGKKFKNGETKLLSQTLDRLRKICESKSGCEVLAAGVNITLEAEKKCVELSPVIYDEERSNNEVTLHQDKAVDQSTADPIENNSQGIELNSSVEKNIFESNIQITVDATKSTFNEDEKEGYYQSNVQQVSQPERSTEEPQKYITNANENVTQQMEKENALELTVATQGGCRGCDVFVGEYSNSRTYLKLLANNLTICPMHRYICMALMKTTKIRSSVRGSLPPTPRTVCDSTVLRKPLASKDVPFAICEDRRLKRGILKLGVGNWEAIRKKYVFAPARTATDLERRWSQLEKENILYNDYY